MLTIKALKHKLSKFPNDAVCYVYEGERSGIVIELKDTQLGKQGFIYCNESNESECELEAELLDT